MFVVFCFYNGWLFLSLMDGIFKHNYPRMRVITWFNENLSMFELSSGQFITWRYLLPFNKIECITLIWRRQNIYKIIFSNTFPFELKFLMISIIFCVFDLHYRVSLLLVCIATQAVHVALL